MDLSDLKEIVQIRLPICLPLFLFDLIVMYDFWDDSEDEDEEVRRQHRREKWHAKFTKYKGDFWAPHFAHETRIENFKLAHFMQEKFAIFSSDESTYHHLAEDRDWTMRNFKLAEKHNTESNQLLDVAKQTLENAKETDTKIKEKAEKAEEDAAELKAELASKENELKEKERALDLKERRLDARGVLTDEDATKIDIALWELESEGDKYIDRMETYSSQPRSVSSEILATVRRGEGPSPMPKALENYNSICLKIRGNQILSQEHSKYQILSQELDSCKRSEKMWREAFWGLEEASRSSPAKRASPRKDGSSSEEEEEQQQEGGQEKENEANRKKRRLQASKLHARNQRQQMRALHSRK